MSTLFTGIAGLLVLMTASPLLGQDARRWPRGMSDDPSYFPLAVWLQQPANAQRYKDIGINLYIGLWNGPTEKHLADLARVGMPVICDQNELALKHLDSKTIVGWMHGDEPDNAQPKPKGEKGYNPPIAPAKIIEDYQKIKEADPSRPVILNLGMGVAWDGWHGRGVRTNHPEDYVEYVKGADVVSFDIYPVATNDDPKFTPIRGKLELVPFGVKRLTEWTDGKKPVWSCIETTRIGAKTGPTPEQVRSEVWMAIIQGARGLIYFCHEFKPTVETGLLNDKAMAAAVKVINAQVTELAPVINSPAVAKGVTVRRDDSGAQVMTMTRQHNGSIYVFAAVVHDKPYKAGFTLEGAAGKSVEVIGENRTIDITGGAWDDEFKPYDVHLYRVGQ